MRIGKAASGEKSRKGEARGNKTWSRKRLGRYPRLDASGALHEPVYNLEVEADHCYRVGMQGLLVHNQSHSECRTHGLLPGESLNLVSQSVLVHHRTGPTATPASTTYNFLRVDKKLASLACYGQEYQVPGTMRMARQCKGADERDAGTWMSQLVQYGILAAPPGGLPASQNQTLGRIGDNVGHIVGNQFGGYANETLGRGNVFPQHAGTNQGSYQTFETQSVAREIENGACEVCLLWQFAYDPHSPTPHRPTSFTVTWWVDDKRVEIRLFQNPTS
jgi:hypothetical protein